jgi:hypothetical protein
MIPQRTLACLLHRERMMFERQRSETRLGRLRGLVSAVLRPLRAF